MSKKRKTFWSELKKRNIFRVATVYLIVGWIIIQIADATFEPLQLPSWSITLLIVFLVIGLPIALILAWAYEMSQQGMVRTSSQEAKENPYSKRKKKPLTSNLVIGILIIVVIAQFLYFKNIMTENNISKDGSVAEKSIAVLAFDDQSPNGDQEWLGDGVADEILNVLAQVEGLKVSGKTSSFSFKDKDFTIKEIGDALEVITVLEGSVSKVGDRIRITAQLIDVESDKHLWSDRYDFESEDLFAIMDEVAQNITNALMGELSIEELENIKIGYQVNEEAYEFYLQGLYHLRSGSMEGLNKSYPLLQQAINLDPEFAEAYAEIAAYYIRQGAWRGILTPELAKKEAMPYVLKALELDPYSINGRTQLGTIKWWFEWDFAGAEKEYIMGNSSRASRFYGFFLLLMGRFHDAEDHFAESHRLNPMDPNDRPHRGVVQYFLNHPERAIKILKDGISFYPNVATGYHNLGKIYLNVGNYDEAIKTLELGLEVGKSRIPSFLGELAIAYFKSGQTEKANEIIEELKSIESKPQGSPSFYLAQIYAGIGEPELAFETLKLSYDAHEVEMIWLKIEPQFNSIRNDPRWQEMLDKVGFPD